MEPKFLQLLSHQSLFSSVRPGDIDSLKLVLEGSDVGEVEDEASVSALMALQNDAGETPPYIAAENNLKEVFSYLVKFCDLQTAMILSNSDMDAFHVAALRGNLGVVKELLSRWLAMEGKPKEDLQRQ